MTDFVAACGGLLGLFMGISLLSIVELVYYFSLRLFCSVHSRNARNDSDKNAIKVNDRRDSLHDKSIKFVRSPNLYW